MVIEVRSGKRTVERIDRKLIQKGAELFVRYRNSFYQIQFDNQRRGILYIEIMD